MEEDLLSYSSQQWRDGCGSIKRLLLHERLAIKSRLHKVALTSSSHVVCSKEETMQHVVWRYQFAAFFHHGFRLNFNLCL
jgi:hypothetical protein